jgi:hypothetical protein
VLQTIRKFRAFVRTMIIVTLLLLGLLAGFEYIPLASGNDLQLLSLFSSQEWASQRITKDALIMAYLPIEQRTQAINEMQNQVPFFERNQAAIGTSNLSVDIQVLFTESSTDYTAIDTASHAILAHVDKAADPVEVAIITLHERDFFLGEMRVAAILQQKIQQRTIWLFGIEVGLEIIIVGAEVWRLFAVERLMHAMVRQQVEKEITP